MYNDDIYEKDVFSEIEEDIPIKKPRKPRSKSVKSKPRHSKKEYKVSNDVLELQERYDALAAKEDATKEEWQKFYLSIEKLIMNQAYKTNFNHFVDKSSDLWGYLSFIILESIIPKKNPDGTRSCWYIDPIKRKIRKGYDRLQTNLGNFLLNKTKWTIVEFNQGDYTFASYCTDFDLEPIPDTDDKIEQLVEDTILPDFPYKLEILGQSEPFRKELISLCKLRAF